MKQVRCIDNFNKKSLTNGKAYDVVKEGEGFYVLLNDHGIRMRVDARRFEDVTNEEERVMKQVKCIDDNGLTELTIGKVYDVIDEQYGHYTIICDNGKRLHTLTSRFEDVTNGEERVMKQVKCIDNKRRTELTIGTVYDVIDNCEGFYYVVDDNGERLQVDVRRFEDVTNEEVPQADNAAARKAVPVFSGVLRYFPDALKAVAACSMAGNEQHNPGKPLHWDKSKSGDDIDALTRHLLDAGTIDTDGVRHSTKVAWRALANLQKEIDAAGEKLYK